MTDDEAITNLSSEDLQEDVETMRIKKKHLEDTLENIKNKKGQRNLMERSTQKTIMAANQLAKIDEKINKVYEKLFHKILDP